MRLILMMLVMGVGLVVGQVVPPMPEAVEGGEVVDEGSVKLAWDASPDEVGSYVVHWGVGSGEYEWSTNAGVALEQRVGGLREGVTYYFAATAIGTNGLESEYSNEVVYKVPEAIGEPVGFGLVRVVVLRIEVEGAESAGGPWEVLGEVPLVVRGVKAEGVFRSRMRVEVVEGVDW